MKKILLIAIVCILSACTSKDTYCEIETKYGTMTVLLYDDTPKHKANFVKLAKEGFYKDLLFHRVINEFMIQGGDPESLNAPPEKPLGNGGPGYMIDAEIGAPHFKGALAAARTGDNVNPQRRSSGSQFYIVHGRKWSDAELDNFEKSKGITYSPEQRKLYKELGGVAFLDMDYTVFGEVVDGFDVIDKLASVQTSPADRPIEDLKMDVRLK